MAVFVFIGAAFCCHAIMLTACQLLTFVGDTTDGTYGLFYVSLPDSPDSGTCTEVRSIDEISGRYGANGLIWQPREDDYLRAAQIGGTFSFACGFILLVFVVCRQFFCPLPCSEFLMDVCCLAIQVGLGMVYLIYMSDGCYYFECGLSSAGGVLIAAQVMWMFAFCLTKCMRPSAFQRKKAEEEERKKLEEAEKAAEKKAADEAADVEEASDSSDNEEDAVEEEEEVEEEVEAEKNSDADEEEDAVEEEVVEDSDASDDEDAEEEEVVEEEVVEEESEKNSKTGADAV